LIRTFPLLALFLGPAAYAQEPGPAAAPAGGPVTYKLDPAKSWLYVVVYNDPSSLASRLGHDHGIKATEFTGTVVWDTANAGACSVDISFPVSALRPDPPGMRERAALPADGAVGEGSLETIRENLLGKGQLDAATYPTISYKSKSCEGTTGKVKVNGDLTIHGVTKPVAITLDVKADPTSFVAGGAVTTTFTNFGFKPFSNLGGALRTKDEFKLVVDVVGAKAP
jgi:polyisoprenoid-binding protein YceI